MSEGHSGGLLPPSDPKWIDAFGRLLRNHGVIGIGFGLIFCGLFAIPFNSWIAGGLCYPGSGIVVWGVYRDHQLSTLARRLSFISVIVAGGSLAAIVLIREEPGRQRESRGIPQTVAELDDWFERPGVLSSSLANSQRDEAWHVRGRLDIPELFAVERDGETQYAKLRMGEERGTFVIEWTNPRVGAGVGYYRFIDKCRAMNYAGSPAWAHNNEQISRLGCGS